MEIEERTFVVVSNGFSPEDTQAWSRKYWAHRGSAVERGLRSKLTFDQYLNKASEAGLVEPGNIGLRKGKFQLGRIGDEGDYTNENCRFIPGEQNRREAFQNGKHDEAIKASSSATSVRQLGQTKETSERVRRMAETRSGRTKETHQGTAAQAQALAKEFVLTDPDGTIHQGKNANEFAKAHNLDQSTLSKVLLGKKPSHKGWTGHYVDSNKK
jgi:hypothetical protein